MITNALNNAFFFISQLDQASGSDRYRMSEGLLPYYTMRLHIFGPVAHFKAQYDRLIEVT